MKNFKRILALVIAIIMVVGTFASLSAAGSKWYSKAVSFIEDNGIAVIGTNADKKITRNEFVLWVAKIESHQLSDTAWNEQVANTTFTDVTDAHHKAAIAYSARRNFIIGNGDGTFSPDKATTFAEACAVIVRVMGYENKVYDTSADAWAFNYMQVANTYCHAIDDVFMKETDTYNPDYELTQGEAAYLLATIMNFDKQPTDSDYSETSDGINLGEWFDVNGGNTGVVGKAYYVKSINRVCDGESMSTQLAYSGQKGMLYTNELDTAKDVVLLPTDGTASLVINGESFLKMLRISLGLNPKKDIANEEPEINVFSYLDVGSIVNVVIDKSATSTNAYLDNDDDGKYTEGESRVMVSSLSASANSVIVDTYLQATSAKEGEAYGDGSNGATSEKNLIISAADLSKYVGWTIREIGTTENTCPVLPASYSAALATSWTNVVKDKDGKVTSAVLNFKGQTYKVNGSSDEIAIYSGDDLTKVLTLNEAVNAIINIAQGEALVVFNDIDGDGRYDSAIVKESTPFLYVGETNVAGNSNNTYSYYSSLSNGTSIGSATMKGNALGTVIYNKGVEFAAGGTSGVADYRTDGYKLTDKTTGKLQLILRASNSHFFIDGYTTSYGNAAPHFYKVVDLATFGVGIIEEVDAFALDNYYVAKIALTDGTSKTVYIPVNVAEKTTLPVTVDGVTADYTFDSSNWCTFLSKDMKNAVIDAGIVSGVSDPNYKSATAAWMAGKYVQFAVDADSKVIVMLGTDSSANVSGFVTGVTKTNTGDNTFNVSIANYSSGKVAGVSTYEVRANASAMFDWNHYQAYNAIFAGKLDNPYGMQNGRIDASSDLIYVTVYQDAATKYLKYTTDNAISNDSWVNVEGRYNISLTEVADTREYNNDKSVYTAKYTGKVGFKPYYERTYNTTKKAYEYVLKFTKVVEYTNIAGSATAVIDKTKTLMTPVYVGETGTTSIQLKATTEADFATYTIANGYYIDDVTNLVYKIINDAEIVYKTDDKGNIIYSDVKYTYDSQEESKTEEDVPFSTYKVGKYATFTYATADRDTTENWYPGLYTVTFNGVTYKATLSTPVVIVTPSADGFSITTTTLANVSTDGLFVTDINATVDTANNKITAIAVIGETAAAYTDNSGTVTPTTDKGTLVYLDSNAKAVVRALKYGESWIVVSDRSAYALPTGEDIGVIYREYSTYIEATKAASIDLSVVGGHWYRVDENGKILSDASDITYESYGVINLSDYQSVELKGSFTGSNFGTDVANLYVLSDVTVTKTIPYNNNYGCYTVPDGTIGIRDNGNGTYTKYNCVRAQYHDSYNRGNGLYNFRFGKIDELTLVDISNKNLVTGETNIYVNNGKYYLVEGTVAYALDDQMNKIEAEVKPIGLKTGTITKTDAAGNTYATIDGVKNVNVTDYDFAFFYRNADASVLYKAGDSTKVTIATKAIYDAQIKTQQDAYDKAVAAYEEALDKGYLSAERIASYKAAVDEAEAALVEAKDSLLDKYFNGTFWGVPNSPYYLYVQTGSGSFQQATSSLTFNYVKVGDTYCVFSDEFVLG